MRAPPEAGRRHCRQASVIRWRETADLHSTRRLHLCQAWLLARAPSSPAPPAALAPVRRVQWMRPAKLLLLSPPSARRRRRLAGTNRHRSALAAAAAAAAAGAAWRGWRAFLGRGEETTATKTTRSAAGWISRVRGGGGGSSGCFSWGTGVRL